MPKIVHLKWHGRLVCTESPYRFLASISVQSNGDEYVEYHLKPIQSMRTNAPAPAPTYVDFVLAPAGLIGINTNSFGATRGATLRILKIPWMVPHPGDFFLNAQSCAGSKFGTYISNTRISLLQRQLRPRRIENRITNLSRTYGRE